jgi:hypothetical protein
MEFFLSFYRHVASATPYSIPHKALKKDESNPIKSGANEKAGNFFPGLLVPNFFSFIRRV